MNYYTMTSPETYIPAKQVHHIDTKFVYRCLMCRQPLSAETPILFRCACCQGYFCKQHFSDQKIMGYDVCYQCNETLLDDLEYDTSNESEDKN